MTCERDMEKDSTRRNKLLRFFTEKEFSHQGVLKMVKPMEGMTEEQKERHSALMLKAIRYCKTEEKAINILAKKNLL